MKSLETGVLVRILLVLCCCAMPPRGSAHLPALFGKEYVYAEDRPVQAAVVPRDSEMLTTDPVDPGPFEVQVREREIRGGPFADGLAEPLTSLALYYQKRGDYQDAIDAYLRAMHVVRVNDGLISSRQIPILRQLQKIYRTQEDYPSLDQTYEYHFRLHGIGSPPHTPQRVDAALEYLQWQRVAYSAEQHAVARSRLLQAYFVNDRILDSMAESADNEPYGYRQLVMSQIYNLYLLLGDEPVQGQVGDFVVGSNNPELLSTEQVVWERTRHIQRTGVNRGSDLLRDLIARSAQMPAVDRAALHLELGDWYQWNDKLRRASQEYAQVVSLLRDAGETELLNRWLGQPRELPDEADLWLHPRYRDVRPLVEVVARYDVSARGAVSNIKVSVPGEDGSGQASRIRRMLYDTHFRPRFSQGQAEAVAQVSRRYRLLY